MTANTANHRSDRNFDGVASHFANKVYGSLKGDIRLAGLQADIFPWVNQQSERLGRPLRILDVGAGLAQLSQQLAMMGHDVVINDVSADMLQLAQQSWQQLNQSQFHKSHQTKLEQIKLEQTKTDNSHCVNENIIWLHCPYQELTTQLCAMFDLEQSEGYFDLILNHAVLEWLAEPADFIAFAKVWLHDDAMLSLCFYNPASFVYRNLVMGNFKLLNRDDYQADTDKSLTPNYPVEITQVRQWLTMAGLIESSVRGLRVFYDYTTHKRGGLANDQAVIEMECRYGMIEPYKWLGRYLHIMATPQHK